MNAVSGTLLSRCRGALDAADRLFGAGRRGVRGLVSDDEGAIDSRRLEECQHAVHGLAWVATYVEALRQMLRWAETLDEDGRFRETERLILECAFSEYLSQIAGGIAMSQGEIVRVRDLSVSGDDHHAFWTDDVSDLINLGSSRASLARLAELLGEGSFGETGLESDLVMVRDQFRRYADERIRPEANSWHLEDAFIPLEMLHELAELGVFGLSVPEEHGGLGMSKVAMCVVTEELSRGYIGVGSLGTRTEIAAELIINSGTPEQKQRWLPGVISGETIPTAVFTEPGTGSDLGSLKTRAVREGGRLPHHRQQDVDHPWCACRSDDTAGTHRSGRIRLPRPQHVPCREAPG